ncbi:hypothetical protein ITJ43_13380 [Microbacterium sp. VKM Ac-2870]|uniref:hypothetical protein n=1 Tax=Microbacterium sp. VKM Ac-2870 TaxID=2783825 RepID=UPI00188AA8E7|nr:hypothetical protein [Microbacterium sp. VKM Ac-2870]MBF4563124.1 hypothetical protein [Microbacterium sp. VKM Ac-2870]
MHGAIVIVDAKEIKIREQPEDVTVLAAPQLLRWLKKQPPRLDPTQIAAVVWAVRDGSTWSNDSVSIPDAAAFDALRREVEGARRVRMAWGVAVLITSFGVTIPLAY